MSLSWWYGTGLKALALAALAVLGIAPQASSQSGSVAKTIRVEIDGSYLGIEMADITAENMSEYKVSSERGVIVMAVEKGSPAESAGLQAKDVILEYGGMPAFSSSQFARLVGETPAGRKVEIVVSRDGKRQTLSAKIGKRERTSGVRRGGMEIGPGEELEKRFEFRVPGPRPFEFRMPDGNWRSFAMPPGALAYSNEKPRLGVTLQPLTDQMAGFLGVAGKKGALVTSVLDGSPAAGKLKAGDVIIKADDKAIAEPEDLMRLLKEKGKDGKVAFTVVRDKKEMSVAVELAQEDTKGTKGGYKL